MSERTTTVAAVLIASIFIACSCDRNVGGLRKPGGCVILCGWVLGTIFELGSSKTLTDAAQLRRCAAVFWDTQRTRAAKPMMIRAPEIASAAPNRSVRVGACPSITQSQTSDAAI